MRKHGGALVSVCIVAATIVACAKLAPSTSSSRSSLMASTPASHDYGLVEINTTSAAVTFTISPVGDLSSDVISSITGCTGFVIDAPGAAGAEVFRRCAGAGGDGYGEPCSMFEERKFTFTVAFAPTVVGLRTCDVRINGTTNLTIPVRGTGKLPDFAIDVRPADRLEFGDVRVDNDSEQQDVTITNVGGLDLDVTVTESDPAGAFSFTGVPAGTHKLAKSASEVVKVRCTPPATGTVTGSLRVAHNDPKKPAFTIALTCRGVDSSFTVTGAAFATTRVHEHVDRVIQIANAGTASGTLVSVAIDGAASADVTIQSAPPPNLQIAPLGAQTATVVLRYLPSAAFDGPLGSLVLTFAGEEPRMIAMRGTALLAEVDSQPEKLDFKLVCMGKTASLTAAVFAVEMGVFEIQSVNTPEYGFAIAPAAGVTLPVTTQPRRESEVMFDVTVTPTQEGSINSKAVIRTDAPGDEANHEIALTAFALPAGVNATPERLDFGSHHINRTTFRKKVQLANCGDDAVTITAAEFIGPDRDDFNLVDPFESVDVSLSGTHAIYVLMTPSALGTRQAQLVLETSAGPRTIDLTGIGNVDGDDVDTRETYYACGVATTGATWPVLVVLVVLARRRRRM